MNDEWILLNYSAIITQLSTDAAYHDNPKLVFCLQIIKISFRIHSFITSKSNWLLAFCSSHRSIIARVSPSIAFVWYKWRQRERSLGGMTQIRDGLSELELRSKWNSQIWDTFDSICRIKNSLADFDSIEFVPFGNSGSLSVFAEWKRKAMDQDIAGSTWIFLIDGTI